MPGSSEAEQVEQVPQQEELWSQHLEVGIGPNAEVFAKAQALSAVGDPTDFTSIRLDLVSWAA